jgi:hypothetical protein
MNNPDDLKILKEIYSEYGIVFEAQQEQKEYTADDLIQLLQSRKSEFDTDFIQKMYHTVANKGQKLGTQIVEELKKRGLEGSSNEIFSLIHQYAGLEQHLAKFFANKDKQVTIDQLRSGTNLTEIVQGVTGLPTGFIASLIKAGKATEGGKGVGEGEALLALVGLGGKKLKVGDVEIQGKEIEVKGKGGRLIGRAEPLKAFYDSLLKLGVPARRGGTEAIHTYLPYIISQKPEVEQQVQKLFQQEFNTDGNVDVSSPNAVHVTMLTWYVNHFLSNEVKSAKYIFVVIGQEHRLLTKEEFKQQAVEGTLVFGNFTATNKSPQILSFA